MKQSFKIAIDATTVRSGGGPIICAHEMQMIRHYGGDDVELLLFDSPNGLPLAADLPVTQLARPAFDPALARGFARWNVYEARSAIRAARADAYISFTNWIPVNLGVPSALYLHSPYAMQIGAGQFKRLPARLPRFLASQWALAQAEAVIVQTKLIGAQAERAYGHLRPMVPGLGPLRLYEIPPNGSWMDRITPDAAFAEQLKKLREQADFWLFYPSLPWSHKNMSGLAAALKRVAAAGKTVGLILPAGGISPGEVAGQTGFVLQSYDGLKQTQMAACYDFADAVIFPSLLETAGLGLVEALARRRPLLASDRQFVHELCGDAALLFDPDQPERIAAAVLAFVGDPEGKAKALQRADAWRAERLTTTSSAWTEVIQLLRSAREKYRR